MHQLAEQPQARRWLIDAVWADEAVGIVGVEPKYCKSFLTLDMAVAVAGGVPCVRRNNEPRCAAGVRDQLPLIPAPLDHEHAPEL